MSETTPKPLTMSEVFLAVFFALWVFTISAGVLYLMWEIFKGWLKSMLP